MKPEISNATFFGALLGLFFRPVILAFCGGLSAWIADYFYHEPLLVLAQMAGMGSVWHLGVCIGFITAYIKGSFK